MMAAKGTGLEAGAKPPLPDSSHSVIPPCYHTLPKNFAVVPHIVEMTFGGLGIRGSVMLRELLLGIRTGFRTLLFAHSNV